MVVRLAQGASAARAIATGWIVCAETTRAAAATLALKLRILQGMAYF